MKRMTVQILMIISLAVFFSCKKSPSTIIPPPPPPPPIDTGAIEYKTKVGAFITNPKANFTSDFKAGVLSALHTNYIRNTIVMENWTGVNYDYEYYTNLGYKTLLNIQYEVVTRDSPTYFLTDTVAFKIKLDEILTKYSPEVVLVENEPANFQNHKGPVQDYLNELRAAMTIIHKHGLKGSDGGITNRTLTFLVYRYYFNKGEFAKADDFANRCIPEKYMINLSNPGRDPGFEKNMVKWDSLIQGYKTIPMDYVCAHLYEPIKYRNEDNATELSKSVTSATPGAFQEIADYIYAETGKPMISNEMGQLNLQPALVSSMLTVCNLIKMPYTIWFSGDWGIDGSYALQEPTGVLRDNGIAFRNFIDAHPQ